MYSRLQQLPDSCGIYCSLLCYHCYEEASEELKTTINNQIKEMIDLFQ